jgi:hypothetical protein
MCEFVDDSLSAFKFNDLIACGCDSLVEWTDFNPEVARPRCARVLLARYTCTYLDIVSAFVSIKKTLTTSGRNVTFKAGRGGNDGHADLAWATMHILMNEPLDGKEKPRGTMEIIE